MKKWTRTYRNAKKTRDTFNEYLVPFKRTIWDQHRDKHKEIFVNIEHTEKQMIDASRKISRIKRLLAYRHGWSGND